MPKKDQFSDLHAPSSSSGNPASSHHEMESIDITHLAGSFGNFHKRYGLGVMGLIWFFCGAHTIVMTFVTQEPPRFPICSSDGGRLLTEAMVLHSRHLEESLGGIASEILNSSGSFGLNNAASTPFDVTVPSDSQDAIFPPSLLNEMTNAFVNSSDNSSANNTTIGAETDSFLLSHSVGLTESPRILPNGVSSDSCNPLIPLDPSDCNTEYFYFHPTATVVSEFGVPHIGCTSGQLFKSVAWTNAIFFFGFLLGVLLLGRLADVYGRKALAIGSIGIMEGGALASCLTGSLLQYGIARCIVGFGVGGSGLFTFLILAEITSQTYRPWITLFHAIAFALGGCFTCMCATVIPSWRLLIFTIVLPSLGCFRMCCSHYAIESPRWLAAKGFGDRALATWKLIATTNGKELPSHITAERLVHLARFEVGMVAEELEESTELATDHMVEMTYELNQETDLGEVQEKAHMKNDNGMSPMRLRESMKESTEDGNINHQNLTDHNDTSLDMMDYSGASNVGRDGLGAAFRVSPLKFWTPVMLWLWFSASLTYYGIYFDESNLLKSHRSAVNDNSIQSINEQSITDHQSNNPSSFWFHLFPPPEVVSGATLELQGTISPDMEHLMVSTEAAPVVVLSNKVERRHLHGHPPHYDPSASFMEPNAISAPMSTTTATITLSVNQLTPQTRGHLQSGSDGNNLDVMNMTLGGTVSLAVPNISATDQSEPNGFIDSASAWTKNGVVNEEQPALSSRIGTAFGIAQPLSVDGTYPNPVVTTLVAPLQLPSPFPVSTKASEGWISVGAERETPAQSGSSGAHGFLSRMKDTMNMGYKNMREYMEAKNITAKMNAVEEELGKGVHQVQHDINTMQLDELWDSEDPLAERWKKAQQKLLYHFATEDPTATFWRHRRHLGLTTFVAFLLEVPVAILTVCLAGSRCCGRRGVISGSLLLGSLFGLAAFVLSTSVISVQLSDEGMVVMITVLANLCRLSVSGTFLLLYLYSSELYPTSVRASVVGLLSTAARIAGISAPIIVSRCQPLLPGSPLLIIGLCCLLSAVLSCCILPETLGIPLADTVTTLRMAYHLKRRQSIHSRKWICCCRIRRRRDSEMMKLKESPVESEM